MIRKIILLFLLLFLAFLGCTPKRVDSTTSPAQDSIQKYLVLAGNDTLDYDKRIEYNDKALSFIDTTRNDSLTRSSLNKISFMYNTLNENLKVKEIANKTIQMSHKTNDSFNLAFSYRNLGLHYMSKSENENAIKYLFKAKTIFSSLSKFDNVLNVMGDISITQYYACDYLGSNKTAFEILRLSKKSGTNRYYFLCNNMISNNLCGLKQFEKAIKYYSSIDENQLDIVSKNILYTNIASAYIDLKKFEKAELYLKKIVSIERNKVQSLKQYAIANSLLALVEIESGKKNDPLKLLIESDSILSKLNSLTGINYNQIYLSKFYFSEKDLSKAILHAKKAFQLSKNYKNPNDVLLSLSQLIKVDKKNAQKYAQEYIRITDSLQIAERNFRDKFAQIEFETQEIKEQKDIALKQRTIIVIVALVLILILILLFIISRQRLKQKEYKLSQLQQKTNEEVYELMLFQKDNEEKARTSEKNRIALELHDGVMNRLTSIRLNLSILKKKREDSIMEKCISYIDDIYNVETEIRNITHNLNQTTIENTDDFLKLLEDLIERLNDMDMTHFFLKTDSTVNWNKMTNSQKMNLYRIIQEACQNILKHAKATKATIEVAMDKNNLSISIHDNGIGFKESTFNKGIGLKNIKHRVASLNGKFSIHSKKGQTTTLGISIPIDKNN